MTARLQHPAIVPVYRSGRGRSGQPFYAMKQVTGDPLDRVIAKADTLAARIALLPSAGAKRVLTDAVTHAGPDVKPATIAARRKQLAACCP